MKYINLIIALILLSSCSTNKSVVGLYGKCKKHYFTCTQIELKPDKTFEYFIFMDVGGTNIMKGIWNKAINDTVILNSYNQPKIVKTTYTGKINPELEGKIRIHISDKNGNLSYAQLQINDSLNLISTNKFGITEVDVKFLKTIQYIFLNHKETIKIDNPSYNEIEILIRDLDAVPEFLTDYKVVVNRKKMVMDSKYFYKKTRLKNKQWK